ncbi:NEDD4 family-interacting protein 1-like isoform X2 [Phymastichus coffea]|uniref:NEDD4 family-interacting protein 1-like isoform X2 n=1 Tax=Phymastichus coffea TaxID=108790 RepID=UPI00273B1EAF|nr:NEDD4 family-interacting protein 1-like isoform X2 [Phymastichus coffea]
MIRYGRPTTYTAYQSQIRQDHGLNSIAARMDDDIHSNMAQASVADAETSQSVVHSIASGTRQNTTIDQHEEITQEAQVSSRAQIAILTNTTEEIPPPKPDFSAPPPYEVATKLPSYEEVQREKTLQGEPIPQIHPQIHLPGVVRAPQQPLTILTIDTDGVEGDPESTMLGTDFMFFTAFLVAFLFNWIGFLLLMCFCHTIASRYGALSGFGLSLTKWTLIVKHSTDLASRENSWLWWLIMAFGMLICVRAIIQYLNIKRGWRLLSGSAQERLLFYY